ncbi:MAG: hypothetical protein J7M18_00915 [Candidatus Eremiobacteraeota bacterium]|nr:hypothetical protein [Candidatus Eremiobacteraeota bacterium]
MKKYIKFWRLRMLDYLRYRWRLGMAAHVFHRITGVALVLYLIIHLWITHYISTGPVPGQTFNHLMALFSGILSPEVCMCNCPICRINRFITPMVGPIFRYLEVILLGIILFHSLNGLRIILIDTGWGVKHHKVIFWILLVFGMCGFLFGAWQFLKPI